MILTLQLEGPMAGWCVDGRQRYRPTQMAPSKDAIVGLLACALGRKRGTYLGDLQSLGIDVETVATGEVFTDYHTITNCATYDGKSQDRTAITYRQYVSQPRYRVTIQGDGGLLELLSHALTYPQWQLYLGRRSCPLSRPPVVSLQ